MPRPIVSWVCVGGVGAVVVFSLLPCLLVLLHVCGIYFPDRGAPGAHPPRLSLVVRWALFVEHVSTPESGEALCGLAIKTQRPGLLGAGTAVCLTHTAFSNMPHARTGCLIYGGFARISYLVGVLSGIICVACVRVSARLSSRMVVVGCGCG